MPHGYRYRGAGIPPVLAQAKRSTEKILGLLATHRGHLIECRARIRALTAARNEAVAHAVHDGVRISKVAATVGETVPRVRAIVLSSDAPVPELARAAAEDHLLALRAAADALTEAAACKAATEEQLGPALAAAFQLGFTDPAHLASISGLPPDEVDRNIRSARRRAADGHARRQPQNHKTPRG